MPLDVGPVTPYRTLAARLRDWAAGLFTSFGSSLATAADAATARGLLGLGTAAVKNTGTSGDAVPLLNVINTWTATQVYSTTTPGGSPLTCLLTENGALQGVTNLWHNSASPAAADGIWSFYMLEQDSGANITLFASLDGSVVDPTNGSEDGQMAVGTVVAGAYGQRVAIRNGMFMAGATGGDQGAGTFNATGVYDDGVLLSCYPFDAALDGAMSLEKWDGKAPDRHWPAEYEVTSVLDDQGEIVGHKKRLVIPAEVERRQHFGARKFAARLGGEFDPLDLDKYTAHWRQKRHLTSLPNEAKYDPAKPLSTGEWIQRLVETVEIQAIHIASLHERLKVQEAKGT